MLDEQPITLNYAQIGARLQAHKEHLQSISAEQEQWIIKDEIELKKRSALSMDVIHDLEKTIYAQHCVKDEVDALHDRFCELFEAIVVGSSHR